MRKTSFIVTAFLCFVGLPVGAQPDPNHTIDFSAASPGLMAMMNAVSGAQIRRYNFETVLLARDAVRQAAADLSRDGHVVAGHFVDVDFENFPRRRIVAISNASPPASH